MSQIDILSAIRQIAAERKIEPEEIIEAIKEGIKQSYSDEKGYEDTEVLEVVIEPDRGYIAVYQKKKVVNEVTNDESEISLAEAKKSNAKAKLGDTVLLDVTTEGDFGRIAAQSARQVILSKLRDAEKEAVLRQFQDKIGGIINVVVQRVLPEGEVICEVNKARAVMPKDDRIPFEYYRIGSTIKVLLKSIEEDVRGRFMLISRSDPDFLKQLFIMEVPEIESETVEIVSIAREAGSRSKVAVKSNTTGVDPIGACVGQKGVRINAISNELKIGEREEKIDIIPFSEDIEKFLMNSISPAEAIDIKIFDRAKKIAVITVPDEKLSLAIGRDGQNTRLASKLTGWNIDIKGDGTGSTREVKAVETDDVEEVSEDESEE